MTRALIITIPDRKDSFDVIQQQLQTIGVNAHLFHAVDARQPNVLAQLLPHASPLITFFLGKHRFAHWQMNTPGQLGCWQSHVNAWKSIAQQTEPCIVTEDDFRLKETLPKDKLSHIVSTCHDLLKTGTFDFISMGYLFPACSKKTKQPSVTRILSPFWGFQCYMISPIGAQKMLKYCHQIEFQIDYMPGILAVVTAGTQHTIKVGQLNQSIYQQARIKSTLQVQDGKALVGDPSQFETMFAKYYEDPTVYNLETRQKTGQDVTEEMITLVTNKKSFQSGMGYAMVSVVKPDSNPQQKYAQIHWYMSPAIVIALSSALLLVIVLLFVLVFTRKK